jgi:hypothetical protein
MFQVDNTEGYTAAQLATMNAAVEKILSIRGDSDDWQERKNVEDAITNEWGDDATIDQLVTAVFSRFRWKVEARYGEDHDTGRIIAIRGDMAEVAWDSGVRTPCPIADLRS